MMIRSNWADFSEYCREQYWTWRVEVVLTDELHPQFMMTAFINTSDGNCHQFGPHKCNSLDSLILSCHCDAITHSRRLHDQKS